MSKKEELQKQLKESQSASHILWAINDFLKEILVKGDDIEVMYKCLGFVTDLQSNITSSIADLNKKLSELEPETDEKTS